MSNQTLPPEMHAVRDTALRAIAPIKPADANTKFCSTKISEGLYASGRTNAGQNQPPYYLVYFLLVSLLGFKNYGASEKVAWAIPIDLEGSGFTIEYRKFGIGVFTGEPEAHEEQAARIVELIRRGVKAAKPFFRWTADEAVRSSEFNVINKGKTLYERYLYMRGLHAAAVREAEARKDEKIVTEGKSEFVSWTSIEMPYFTLRQKADWLATSAIDAFFAWTEHVFIHLAILQGRITNGTEFTALIGADWSEKFKAALSIDDPQIKKYYDDLLLIRRQTRNYMAHGAFGKNGEALRFHSATGAVPVTLDYTSPVPKFFLGADLPLVNASAIEMINEFINLLWQGPRAPAKIYIEESGLPLILPMASDGTYATAMSSVEAMGELVSYLSNEADNAANMDW